MSVVGIDLGTTNTVVACVRSGKVHVLADEHGSRLLPSVVSFHPNGDVLVGATAKSRRVIDPRNTIYSHKRLIGRSWGSPEIAQAKQRFAFELKEGPGQGPLVHARGSDYTLPEISAFVLKRARQIAEQALGTPVERAVITVPAHFNELQRASTKVAGRVSGLEVLRILNEPTAAALAYGLGRTGNERVAVYDFGGGTFDCTLLDLNGNVFEVLATAGDSFLGGDDVDNLIADRMAETFLKAHRYDPRQDAQLYERLKTTAEEIKMVLSTAETHTVVLKEFGQGLSSGGGAINFNFTLTRRDLDGMITPLVDRSFQVTQDALSLARLTPTSFDKVILVGGSTRIPLVRKRVESFFGAPPMDRVNPDEVVAIGAAIQAAALTEGARKRSLPAPPPIPGQPRTLPGVQNDTQDNTQTGTMNTDDLKPAFGSAPPAFGFTPSSNRPPATKSGPPPTGATGARPPADTLGGGRKITNPGVAPATQPLGARSPIGMPGARTAPAPPPEAEEDPSIASFPDLAVPTPFEWFPSGQPSSGEPQGSERSFGGNNTITKTGMDQQTLTAHVGTTQAMPQVPMPVNPRPAAGQPPESRPRAEGFGAIDEPPSMFSTPDASVPSFPSMAGASTGGMPSPIGEPEPFGVNPDVPGGQFGAVKDLSLISSSGVSSGGAPVAPAPGEFGHVPDLSLISTNTATAAMDAITSARQKALEEGAFDDDTEANANKPVVAVADEHADLPAVVQQADLPALAGRKAPQIQRKTGQVGMSSGGGSAMLGKPPPAVAPQPFGPMERIDEEQPIPSRTAAMPGRPPPMPAPSRPGAQPTKQSPAVQAKGPASGAGRVKTQLGHTSPAAKPNPMATTAPLERRGPAQPNTSPGAFPAGPPPEAYGSRPPPPLAPPQPQRPPATQAFGSTAAMSREQRDQTLGLSEPFASSPPAGRSPSGPPLGLSEPFASNMPPAPAQGRPVPPAAFGSGAPIHQLPQQPAPVPGFGQPAQPPPTFSSQPPMFGNFQSAPPMQQAPPPPPPAPEPLPEHGNEPLQPDMFNPNTAPIPGAPNAPQHLGFAAPVLVDVTPRALVVETAGGYTDTIIPRNSKIPCERTRRFATGRDMQTTVRVRVGQGEHQYFPQNTYLGEVELSGLRPAPRGEVVVAVTFEVDADGTLRIRARDVQTGQEARATLQLVGVADESSVVMMINRFAQQPVVGGGPGSIQ